MPSVKKALVIELYGRQTFAMVSILGEAITFIKKKTGDLMKHIIFLVLILSGSIGLSSLSILFLAFIKFRLKILIYLFLFLCLIIQQFALDIYISYQYANFNPLLINYEEIISFTLFSFMIILLPLIINEWLDLRNRKIINIIFGGIFLISLVLIYTPFFSGIIEQGVYFSSLLNSKIFWGISFLPCLYVFLVFVRKFSTIKDSRDQFFLIFSLICLMIEIILILIPIYPTMPENLVIYAPLYFFWNVALLRYIIRKFFLNTASKNSLSEIVNRLTLTEREKEILLLLVQGKSNQKISMQLFISVDTVKTHIKNIYKKLEVNNRLQLFNLLKETQL